MRVYINKTDLRLISMLFLIGVNMLVLPIIAASPRLARAFIRDTAVMIFWYVPLRLAQVPLVGIYALAKLRSRRTRKPAPELMYFALK